MKKDPFSAKKIAEIDRDDMRDLLITFPEQCEEALAIGKKALMPARYKKQYSNIVFLGLGGSAIGADIIRSYLAGECQLPIRVVRDYSLPRFVNKDSLIFVSSYSGNTEETLSMYQDALTRKANIIVITSGGRLESLAKENKNLLVTIPMGFPPRSALGYSLIPALILLSSVGIIKDKTADIKKMIILLKAMLKNDLKLSGNNISKRIALNLYGTFPVIYAAAMHMNVVAVRWKGQIAENAKTLSSSHEYPEMNHNEIVGWCRPRSLLKKFMIINLRDKKDHPRVKIRMDVTNSILKRSGFKVIELISKGDTLLSRMMSLVYIGDFVSFYLAVLNKIDPTPVERITYLKGKLAGK